VSGVALSGMVSLHLGSCGRSHLLLDWLEDWCDLGNDVEVLEPEVWFTKAHTPGCVGWFPAQVTADTSIDQLCEAVHKRPVCFHVFSIPLLMTNRWRKQLPKATGVNFVLKPGSEIWPLPQHDQLGIFISLPVSRHEPWRLRKSKSVVDLANALREVKDTDHVQKGGILREFLHLMRQMDLLIPQVRLAHKYPISPWGMIHPPGGDNPVCI
jgi:hypothetical protein